MSQNKSNEALIATILQRWSKTHNPAIGATVVASIAAVAKTRHTLDVLCVTQKNQATGAHTATLTVRDASVAGDVLASFDFLTAAAASDKLSFDLKLPGLINSGIFVTMVTVLASVKTSVTMTGYSESFS